MLTPIRSNIFRSSGCAASRAAMASCSSMALCTAETVLEYSINSESPAVPTTRPPCLAIKGFQSSRRYVFIRSRVSASLAPIRRE